MGLFGRKKKDDVVDIRDGDVVDLTEPTPVRPSPGAPQPCPECHGPGYLDHVDLTNRFQRQHCKACGHEWEWSWSDDDVESVDDDFGIHIPGL